ncbi:hypothetical protein Avbf_02839 [Armadillidium vulgare]|nr:hypothetical protein Avbf_02839 [Armadillidium vulgare]
MSNPKVFYYLNNLSLIEGASLVSSRTRPFWEYKIDGEKIPTGTFRTLYPRFIAKLLKKSENPSPDIHLGKLEHDFLHFSCNEPPLHNLVAERS